MELSKGIEELKARWRTNEDTIADLRAQLKDARVDPLAPARELLDAQIAQNARLREALVERGVERACAVDIGEGRWDPLDPLLTPAQRVFDNSDTRGLLLGRWSWGKKGSVGAGEKRWAHGWLHCVGRVCCKLGVCDGIGFKHCVQCKIWVCERHGGNTEDGFLCGVMVSDAPYGEDGGGCLEDYDRCVPCGGGSLKLSRCERCGGEMCRLCLENEDCYTDEDGEHSLSYCSACWEKITEEPDAVDVVCGKEDPERISHITHALIFPSYFRDNFLCDNYPMSRLWYWEDAVDIFFYYINDDGAEMSTMRWRVDDFSDKWFQTTFNPSSMFAYFVNELEEQNDYADDEDKCSCCPADEKEDEEEDRDSDGGKDKS